MSEGLEALAELYSYIKPSFDYQTAKAVEDYKIIETELKEHEQHKVVEQELGINFITLIKALREGFVDGNGEYHHFSNLFIDNIEIFDSYEKVSFYLNDYGKTWALTREELE